MMTNTQGMYNRCLPLIERKKVPCEVIYSTSDKKFIDKKKVYYTLRILQGHRPVTSSSSTTTSSSNGSNLTTNTVSGNISNACNSSAGWSGFMGGKKTECAIRIEISNEYYKCSQNSGSSNQISSMPKNVISNDGLNNTNFSNSTNGLLSNVIMYGNYHTPSKYQNLQREYPQHNNNNNHNNLKEEIRQDTDDPIPITLYELEVGESDFVNLQQDQALLVDFENFAKSLIDLLLLCDLGQQEEKEGELDDDKYCSDETKTNHDLFKNHPANSDEFPQMNPLMGCQLHSNGGIIMNNSNNFKKSNVQANSIHQVAYQNDFSSSSSKYTVRIEEVFPSNNRSSNNTVISTTGNQMQNKLVRFSIVESNHFRELTHIALNLKVGTDATTKCYLSTRLTETIGQKYAILHDLQKEKEKLEFLEKNYKDITIRYNELMRQSQMDRNTLVQEADESIQRELSKRNEILQRIYEEKESDIQTLKKSSAQSLSAIQLKYDELEQKYASLDHEKMEVEQSMKCTQERLSEMESKNKILEEEISTKTQQYTIITEQKQGVDDLLNQLKNDFDNLQQSKFSEEKELCKLQSVVDQLQSKNNEQQNKIEQYVRESTNTQKDIEIVREEYTKSKELLVRYQHDRHEMKKRLKTKADEIQNHEEKLAAKEEALMESKQKLEATEKELETLKQELLSTKSSLSSTVDQLEECKKTIAIDQQVISWLNKEIGDKNKYARNNKIPHSVTTFNNIQPKFGPTASSAMATTTTTSTPIPVRNCSSNPRTSDMNNLQTYVLGNTPNMKAPMINTTSKNLNTPLQPIDYNKSITMTPNNIEQQKTGTTNPVMITSNNNSTPLVHIEKISSSISKSADTTASLSSKSFSTNNSSSVSNPNMNNSQSNTVHHDNEPSVSLNNNMSTLEPRRFIPRAASQQE